MTDPVAYTTKVQNQFITQPEFLFWRGRILLYNGQVDIGKKHIKQCLSIDPDSTKYQKYWKAIQKLEKLKIEAGEAFKNGDIATALTIYDECLTMDPLYNEFNMTIYFNKACALAKVNRNEEALLTLNQAIEINKQYVKAYFKRGDILLALNRFDEAIAEYNRVKEINPQTPGLREKLKHA